MINELVFNSSEYPQGKMLELACGYVSENQIAFQNENIIVTVEAKTGEVVFFEGKRELLRTCVPLPAAGDEKFSEVQCCVEGTVIRLSFPDYGYQDHYPNCDGEHDRWTKYIKGFTHLRYDRQTNTLASTPC